MSGAFYEPYDYAWKTPGWSAQNPVMPSAPVDGYADPGYPSDVTLVHIVGVPMEWETGRPLESVLTVRSTEYLTYTTTGQQVVPGVKKKRFRANTGIDLWLPATDDPQLAGPSGWYYEGSLTVHGYTQKFNFRLPSANPEVSVFSLIANPVVTDPGTPTPPATTYSHLASDTDGVPYYDAAGSSADLYLRYDTDGVAYFTSTGPSTAHLASDTDNVPYVANGA